MEEILKSLAAGGVPGAILAFLLWKVAPVVSSFRDEVCLEIRKLEEAVGRSTKADLLRLLVSPAVSAQVKEEAAEQIKDIEIAQTELEARNKAKEKPIQQPK